MARFIRDKHDGEPDWKCECGTCPARYQFCPQCKMMKPELAREQQERLEKIHREHPRDEK